METEIKEQSNLLKDMYERTKLLEKLIEKQDQNSAYKRSVSSKT